MNEPMPGDGPEQYGSPPGPPAVPAPIAQGQARRPLAEPGTALPAGPGPYAAPSPPPPAGTGAEDPENSASPAEGEAPADADDGPQPLGLRVEPTGHPPVDAQLKRLGDADHLAVSGHLEVYEDVHRGLRDTLTALDRHDPRS